MASETGNSKGYLLSRRPTFNKTVQVMLLGFLSIVSLCVGAILGYNVSIFCVDTGISLHDYLHWKTILKTFKKKI